MYKRSLRLTIAGDLIRRLAGGSAEKRCDWSLNMHKKAPKLGKSKKCSREVGMRVLDSRTTLKAGGATLAAPFLVRVARADETVNVSVGSSRHQNWSHQLCRR
jgi:hypothetical protein